MVRRQFRSRVGRIAGLGAVALGCLALANCTTSNKLSSRIDPKYGVSASPRVIEPGQPVPKGGGTYRVGKPYVVAGRTYYPAENRRYRKEGIASWYGDDFHGRLTANGEIYDMEGVSAAHPTLPMPSYARVTNLHNGRSLIVRVNDRGPYHAEREIDLSSKAAELLNVRRAGTGRVRVEYVGAASLEGSDDRKLLATLREGRPAPAPSTVMVASARPVVPQVASVPQRLAAVMPERRIDVLEERDPPPRRVTVIEARPLPSPSPSPPPSLSPAPLPRPVTSSPVPPVIEVEPRMALPPGPTRGEPSIPTRPEPRLVWTAGPAPIRTSPVSAYAPVQGEIAVTNGRGLY